MMNRLNFRRRLMMESQKDRIIDLSMRDVYGNPIKRSTANCYVVKEPGQYKFPLVYGNAIKNGEVNTEAFTNNGSEYSHDFVTSLGTVITQPYILQGNLTVAVVNSDCDVISDITTIYPTNDKPYGEVTFTVNEVPSVGGNVIMGLTAPSNAGYERWSWHIWLWPHDLTPVEITNATGVKYNIMPVNLASKYDEDGVHIKNWFYQWGRPNPMLLPSAYNSTKDHTPGNITRIFKAGDLATGLKNPSTFYYNSSSPYNWFDDKNYYNLWDASRTGVGNSDNNTVKTVYDPCPVGWKVPNGNTFTGFSDSNVVGSFNNGWYFKRNAEDTTGVFFPVSGFRRNANGALYSVNSNGNVWLSSISSKDYVHYMYFDANHVYPQGNTPSSSGYSVRPVEDDSIEN